MSFFTALSLSLNNLMTKKGRTFLTAFAGSIGIIGIALILSLSSGVQKYINKVEEDTLSSYPITIQKESVDMSSMMEAMMGGMEEENIPKEDGKIYTRNIMTDIISNISQEIKTNNLREFKKYIENEDKIINDNSNAIQYSYDLKLNLYKTKEDGSFFQVNPSQVVNSFGNYGDMIVQEHELMSMGTATDVWSELLDNPELLKTQYKVLAGHFPEKYNEVVLIVDENNQISDYTLYSLGLKDINEVTKMFNKISNGELVEKGKVESYTYDDFLKLEFNVLLNTDYYKKENGIWINKITDNNYMKEKLES